MDPSGASSAMIARPHLHHPQPWQHLRSAITVLIWVLARVSQMNMDTTLELQRLELCVWHPGLVSRKSRSRRVVGLLHLVVPSLRPIPLRFIHLRMMAGALLALLPTSSWRPHLIVQVQTADLRLRREILEWSLRAHENLQVAAGCPALALEGHLVQAIRCQGARELDLHAYRLRGRK